MSSKLVKGGLVGVEEISWNSAGPLPSSAPAVFAPPPAAPTAKSAPSAPIEHAETIALKKQLLACQEQAELHVHEAHQKGMQQGLNQGLQQGVQQGEASVRQLFGTQQEAALQKLARTVEEISGMRQRCRYAAEQDVVKLALAIARRVIHRELTVDPSALLGLVKAALSSLDVRELHRIRIHPGQAEALRQQLGAMGLPQRCEVVADAALEKGAAILETSHGTVDASAGTQLEEIERGFVDLVRQAT